MRTFAAITFLVFIFGSQPALAQEKMSQAGTEAASSKLSAAEESAELAEAAREKAEAEYKDRQRRMERVMRGICIGC